ncbi:site-specific DNA-methyltransferase [Candidatus Woesearchaeota archaeon]|nr:site-specific DNA-methyltransferase [Candidatus Woesearchaeota archaeon]
MVNNFNDKLTALLKKDLRFVDDESGELIRSEIINEALKIDKKLIEALLSEKDIKEKFFSEIKEHWVFEINKFIDFIQDKNFLSDSYTKFKQNIRLTIDGKTLKERGEVVLVWPFKDCVLEGGMTKEDEKRNEIFFNEILAQDEIDRLLDAKVLTNFKRFTAKGEEKVTDFKRDKDGIIRENLIIKGNNLLALHSLRKEFQGKVKLIYIDPPYNTGGATEIFTYNNNFKHSTWLTFMKNRLEVAKDFLKEDGFIAITIDHVELFYLGALSDEVFGRENRLGIVSVVIRPQGRQFAKYFSTTTEYMLVYAKNTNLAEFRGVVLDEERKAEYEEEDEAGKFKYEPLMYSRFVEEKLSKAEEKYFYPIYVSKDLKELTLDKKTGYYEVWPINKKRKICWRMQKESFKQLLEEKPSEYKALKDDEGNVQVFEKYRESEGTKIKTHWIGKRYNATTSGTGVLKSILGEKIFSYPKALYAVVDTLKIMTSKEDIIMDFFAGSGTTAHATLELNKEDGENRQFILVEQLDSHMDVILKRIRKVMELNGKEENLNTFNKKEHFVYGELLKFNEEAVDKIESVKSADNLLKIWKEMVEHYFLNYDVDIKRFNDNK